MKPITGITNQTREVYLFYRDKDDTLVTIKNTDDFVRVYGPQMQSSVSEQLIACFTDDTGKRLGDRVLSGDRNMVHVPVSEILRTALVLCADNVYVMHNHPTDKDPEPSEPDILTTADLVNLARMVGIFVQDHLIINHQGKTFSLRTDPSMSERWEKINQANVQEREEERKVQEEIKKIAEQIFGPAGKTNAK